MGKYLIKKVDFSGVEGSRLSFCELSFSIWEEVVLLVISVFFRFLCGWGGLCYRVKGRGLVGVFYIVIVLLVVLVNGLYIGFCMSEVI